MVAKGRRRLTLYKGIGRHKLRHWPRGAMTILRIILRMKRIIHVDPQTLRQPIKERETLR